LSVGREHVGRNVGEVVAFNTLGGIVGVMLCGFVLIPLLGLVRTLGLLAIIAAAIGYFAVRKGHGVKKGRRQGVIAVGLVSLALALLTPVDKLASLLPGARNGTLAFYEEGRGGTVAVVTQGKGQRAFQRLYIQGVSNTGDAMPSLRYMRIQALLPLVIHNGEPRSALVIGFGTGITAGALTAIRAWNTGWSPSCCLRWSRRRPCSRVTSMRLPTRCRRAPARRSPGTAAQPAALRPDHPGTATALRCRRGQPVFPGFLSTGRQSPAETGPGRPVAAIAHAEHRRLAFPGA